MPHHYFLLRLNYFLLRLSERTQVPRSMPLNPLAFPWRKKLRQQDNHLRMRHSSSRTRPTRRTDLAHMNSPDDLEMDLFFAA
jgi:hypothetical protein